MEYRMRLTGRHPSPEVVGNVYPTLNRDELRSGRLMKILDAWFDFNVPDDVTKLIVYMSGFEVLGRHLRARCKKKGIILIECWPGTKGRRLIKEGKALKHEEYSKKRTA